MVDKAHDFPVSITLLVHRQAQCHSPCRSGNSSSMGEVSVWSPNKPRLYCSFSKEHDVVDMHPRHPEPYKSKYCHQRAHT